MKKVYSVLITSNNDGNVETSLKTFSSFESATKYLHSEYLDIKAADSEDIGEGYDVDDVACVNGDTETAEWFFLGIGNYWVSGAVYACDVED